MIDLYFIRHGITLANEAGIKQGTINNEMTHLSETGIKQANRLREHFDISFADRIIASPMKRTQDTANILNQDAKLPISYDDRLVEISYGDWDGQKNKELETTYADVYDSVLHDVLPEYVDLTDGGESFEEVIARAKSFMDEVALQNDDQKIVVVTHGFTIKAAVLAAIGEVNDMMVIEEPANTSVTRITIDNGRHYLRFFNRTY